MRVRAIPAAPCVTIRGVAALVLACAFACTSCAAANRIAVPTPYAVEKAAHWPPMAVEGYTTTDGRRHPLPDGYMVAHDDSVTFMSPEGPRSGLIVTRRARVETLHVDSVRSVEARLPDAPAEPGAEVLGGAILVAVVSLLVWYGGILPWTFLGR
jgi:hypothetical protein